MSQEDCRQQEDEKPEIDKEKDVYVVVPEGMAKANAEYIRSTVLKAFADVRITPRMREFLLWVKQGEPHKTSRHVDLHIFHRAKRMGYLESESFKEKETDILAISTFRLSASGRAALVEEPGSGQQP